MRFLQYLTVAVLMVFAGSNVQAEQLKGPKLRSAVTGKTIYLSVATGVELPIKYRSGGFMSGRLKGLASIIPTSMPKKDKGRWWIAKNSLCQTWNKWLKSKSYCYKLSQVKGRVFWKRNDGASGTARIVSH